MSAIKKGTLRMFEGLKSTAAVEAAVGVSFESAMTTAADSCMDVFMFNEDVVDSKIESTIENLLALESAVAKFGLTRALVAFADHDKTLSASISSIPALESMTGDMSVKDSAVAAESLKHVIKSIGANIKYDFTHIFSGFNEAEKRIVTWKYLVDGIEEDMNKKTFNIEKATRTECFIVPFAGLVDLQKSFIRAPNVIHDLWSAQLPTEEAQFEPWLNKIRSEVGGIFKTNEAKITDSGTLSMPFSRYILLKIGEKGNIKAKGYTSDSQVKEVISGFRRLLQAYLSMKALQKTAQEQVKKLTQEGESFDRSVTNKAIKVAKNVTKALMFDGLWGVSGVSMHAIAKLKTVYTNSGDYEGESNPK